MPTATLQIDSWPQTIDEFELLIAATEDDLLNFAFHRLGNLADAEDVVQDVYVQAYRDRTKHRHVTDPKPYLFRMVQNRCTDLVRARCRRFTGPLTDTLTASEDTFSAVGASQEREMLFRLLEGIPEREAEVIRLRTYSDLSFAEVAAVLGASVPTIKSRFRYGIEKLRRMVCPGEETK